MVKQLSTLQLALMLPYTALSITQTFSGPSPSMETSMLTRHQSFVPEEYFFSTSVQYRGITMSYIRIFGNRVLNNNIRICCQSLVRTEFRNACTTLIIYGRKRNTIILRNTFNTRMAISS